MKRQRGFVFIIPIAITALVFSGWLVGTVAQGEGATKGIPGGETPQCFVPTGKLSNANCPKQ